MSTLIPQLALYGIVAAFALYVIFQIPPDDTPDEDHPDTN